MIRRHEGRSTRAYARGRLTLSTQIGACSRRRNPALQGSLQGSPGCVPSAGKCFSDRTGFQLALRNALVLKRKCSRAPGLAGFEFRIRTNNTAPTQSYQLLQSLLHA